VHREVLHPEDATFTRARASDEHDREFLASSDPWFRPVMAKTGPDGALYIADMYRFVLEHPEWIAPETQSRLDLRAGADKGRIYRVFPKGAKLRAAPNLAALDNAALAAALDHPNGWQRDTVQRLLIEREAKTAAPILREFVRSAANPKVRVHALATLGTLQELDLPIIQTALRDGHPQVRLHGIKAAESLLTPDTLAALLKCVDDPEFSVRRQPALTSGFFQDDRIAAALEQLAACDGGRGDMRVCILSSLAPSSPLFAKLNVAPTPASAKTPELPKPSTPDRARVLASYAAVANLKGDPSHGRLVFQQQCGICHKLRGEGQEVGPDLGMVRDKPLDWLLTAIMDPNAAIEDRYRSQSVKLKSGTELLGIVAAETGNNIVLKLPGGTELPILTSDIADRKPTARSLMPEGVETVLAHQDVADVVAWLRAR